MPDPTIFDADQRPRWARVARRIVELGATEAVTAAIANRAPGVDALTAAEHYLDALDPAIDADQIELAW